MDDQPNAFAATPTTSRAAREEAGTWTRLADQIGQFCDAWERFPDRIPEIESYLPSESTPWRRRTLLELVKIDLEQRWTRSVFPWVVEDYLGRWPELLEADGLPPCELVYEEYHIRRATSRPVSVAELLGRFPDHDARLRRLLGKDAATTQSLAVSRPPPALDVGTTIDDFDLLARLGAGAFATVYLARQRSLQRLVALKVSASKSQEAQTLAQLDHPGIVRVYDQRVIADRSLRLLYMQYVPGASLAEVLEDLRDRPAGDWSGPRLLEVVAKRVGDRGVSLSSMEAGTAIQRRLAAANWAETVCLVGIQLGIALHHAHQQGVLHRDLKPANVLLDEQGQPKLVDFNISFCSKLAGATPAAYFGGSLAYMSPEQIEACDPNHPRGADEVDARSDLYSLGVVLWELLYGQRPFTDEIALHDWSATLVAARRHRDQPPSASLALAAHPEWGSLSRLLQRCMSPTVADRPESGVALARELRFCLEKPTREFFQPARNRWREWACRWPLSLVAASVVAANALAGVFNYFYNKSQIVDHLPDAGVTFWNVQLEINSVAFPLGILCGVWIVWPVVTAVATPANPRRSMEQSAENRQASAASEGIRRRCLEMGHGLAMLGGAEWLLAGILYPTAMRWAGTPLSPHQQLHFFVSLALCGAIAATYPFFLVSWLSVRHFYPRLLGARMASEGELAALDALQRRSWVYLALAAALPLVGIMLFVWLADRPARWIPGTLSVTGLVGFGVLFQLTRSLHGWLRTLGQWLEVSREPALIRDESFLKKNFL